MLGKKIAEANQLPFMNALTPEKLTEILIDFPQALIFWDADHPFALQEGHARSIQAMAQVLASKTQPSKVFAITDKPLNLNQELSEIGCFGHHVFRRYPDPATEIFTKLLGAALVSYPLGVERYMPADAKARTILLKETKHKGPAIQAIQNILLKGGTPDRLCTQVVGALDEILINAIFTAPLDEDGAPTRKHLDRSTPLLLEGKHQIEITVSTSPLYSSICVADQFGSLKKDVLLSFIRQNFASSGFKLDPTQAGLGLNGIMQSGLSLLFISRPKVRTEVIIFVPRVENFKDFRNSFRFLSLLSE
ncbi:MAG: hypothetical protein H7222_17520 [Methylotenera sp.]|nr:hypothetical protein [Oligoflexia bacterium]